MFRQQAKHRTQSIQIRLYGYWRTPTLREKLETRVLNMDSVDWPALIYDASQERRGPVRALDLLYWWEDRFSHPLRFACDDGFDYVVKAIRCGDWRSVAIEQIVGTLGITIDAPIPPIRCVELSPELVAAMPSRFDGILPGIAHGSRFQEGCIDGKWLCHLDLQENRIRYIQLALLYGWTRAEDRQLLHRIARPELVYSVDHGHFFGAEEWVIEVLSTVSAALPESDVVNKLKLTAAEIRLACPRFFTLGSEEIAAAVAAPPDEWWQDISQREVLAEHLQVRHAQLIEAIVGLE